MRCDWSPKRSPDRPESSRADAGVGVLSRDSVTRNPPPGNEFPPCTSEENETRKDPESAKVWRCVVIFPNKQHQHSFAALLLLWGPAQPSPGLAHPKREGLTHKMSTG